ncbi:MAG: hypothetical protein MJE66_14270 [Proteobacteria bacterium]|nr:hypothetical protein [Pseudomonadota bacterium]
MSSPQTRPQPETVLSRPRKRQSLRTELEERRVEVAELQRDLNLARTLRYHGEKEIASLEAAWREAETTAEAASERARTYQERSSALDARVRELSAERDELAAQLDAAEADRATHATRAGKLEREVEDLRAEAGRRQESEADAAALAEQLAELRTRLAGREAEIEQGAELGRRLEELDAAARHQAARVGQLSQALTEARERERHAAAAHAREQEEAAQSAATWCERAGALELDLASRDDELATHQEHLAERDREATALRAELSLRVAELDDLRRQHGESVNRGLEQSRRLQELERELEATRPEGERERRDAELAGLRAAVEALEAQRENLTGELAQARETLATLEDRAAAQASELDALRGAEDERETLRADLDAARHELGEATRREGDTKAEHAHCLETQRGHARALETTLAARDRELEATRERLRLLQASLDERDRQEAQHRRRIELLEAEQRGLEARCDDWEDRHADLTRRERSARQHGEALRQVLQELGQLAHAATRPAPSATATPDSHDTAPQSEPESPPLPFAAEPCPPPTPIADTDSEPTEDPPPDGRVEASAAPDPTVESSTGRDAAAETPAEATAQPAALEDALAAISDDDSEPAQPTVFEHWRDAELAARLPARGVSGLADAFAHVLAERAVEDRLRVLSVGPSADGEGFEARVAERARERGAEAFDLLQLDPSEAAGWEPQPDFDLCLWRSGVGRLADAQVVLERVAACLRPGGSLVLFETLPLPAEDGALAAHELSQRLWQLMPERYKHNHRLGTLQLRCPDAPGAESLRLDWPRWLLDAGFQRREFEAFGHLVERLFGAEFGPNFDPTAEGDRDFITEVARLDAGKVEAGVLPARWAWSVWDRPAD